MKMRAWTAFFWIVAAVALLGCGQGRAVAAPETEGRVYIEQYLTTVGQRLGCYFTLEKAPNSPLERAYVAVDPEIASVDALVADLRRQLPGVVVERSASQPKVVHLIDAALAKSKGYVLADRASVAYSGPLSELPDALGKKLDGRIGQRRVFDTSRIFLDYATKAKVEATDKPVREILTAAVPLQSYRALLWNAETRTQDGKSVTWVQYYGPAPTPKPAADSPRG